MIKKMNLKTTILAAALLAFLAVPPAAHALYLTYEVLEVTETGLTIKSESGDVLVLEKDPKDYKVGDKVRYDKKRNRLRKHTVSVY